MRSLLPVFLFACTSPDPDVDTDTDTDTEDTCALTDAEAQLVTEIGDDLSSGANLLVGSLHPNEVSYFMSLVGRDVLTAGWALPWGVCEDPEQFDAWCEPAEDDDFTTCLQMACLGDGVWEMRAWLGPGANPSPDDAYSYAAELALVGDVTYDPVPLNAFRTWSDDDGTHLEADLTRSVTVTPSGEDPIDASWTATLRATHGDEVITRDELTIAWPALEVALTLGLDDDEHLVGDLTHDGEVIASGGQQSTGFGLTWADPACQPPSWR